MKHQQSVVALSIVLAVSSAGCSGGHGGNGTSGPPLSPTSNRNPTITSVSVSPTFGVSGLTNFSMSATATDTDGDALSYQWTFAGSTASGPSANANLSGDGAVTVRLSVTDGRGGSATDARDVTIGNMTGRWSFIFTGVCNPSVPTVLPVVTMAQAGSVVTGDLESPASWCNVPAGQTGRFDPAAPARISATGAFTGARLKIGAYLDTFLDGQMDSTGRVITGTTRAQSTNSTNTFRMVKQ
ncbi:MAG: PKD domain-containing protein [Vicinamibacterales bacterium]